MSTHFPKTNAQSSKIDKCYSTFGLSKISYHYLTMLKKAKVPSTNRLAINVGFFIFIMLYPLITPTPN